jgi:hypothetical protein
MTLLHVKSLGVKLVALPERYFLVHSLVKDQ